MGKNTAIEWTDHTINFWWGCEKLAKRVGDDIWGHNKPRRYIATAVAQARKINAIGNKTGVRQKVFCQSMSDLFEDDHGQPIVDHEGKELCGFLGQGGHGPITTLTDLRYLAFRTFDETPWIDWQIATKRPGNIRRMWPLNHMVNPKHQDRIRESLYKSHDYESLYRPNVWLLTSVENQAAADLRIPELLKCRDLSPVLGLSCEPLLGPLNFRWMIDWVIAGGGARPMHPDWARSLRDQCQAAGVPFFFKQWGDWVPLFSEEIPDGRTYVSQVVDTSGNLIPGTSRKTADCCQMIRVGKKLAGRLFDGREWNEFPALNSTSD